MRTEITINKLEVGTLTVKKRNNAQYDNDPLLYVNRRFIRFDSFIPKKSN